MSRRTVLITGGASGMGLAIARRFREAGERVAIADRDRAALDAAVAMLGGGPEVLAVPVDVASPPACADLVERTVAEFGGLDVVVNCAGVWLEGAAERVTEAEFDRVLAVNLKGTFFVCRHAIPHLERTGGAIVNLASDAGLVGNAGASVYSASKGGVVLLSRSLALELAPRGVRVNAVCPCDVATPMIEFQAATYGGGDPARYKANLLARYPQRERARFATAEEIAEFVHYLASPQAAPITGAAIPIDFGLTAGY
ncbi:MAG: SDR family oxidoreductase [Gammaproteobacteria bacterium]|nr:SDR family oxidoreductase [Gammaproteobacteria bacterium]